MSATFLLSSNSCGCPSNKRLELFHRFEKNYSTRRNSKQLQITSSKKGGIHRNILRRVPERRFFVGSIYKIGNISRVSISKLRGGEARREVRRGITKELVNLMLCIEK